MTAKTLSNGLLRTIAILTALTCLAYLLLKIQTIFIYLLVALILTLIGNPIQQFFKNRLKFNQLFSTIATILFFVIAICGFLLMFVPLISSQSQNLSLLNISSIEKNINLLTNQFTSFLQNHGVDARNMLRESKLSSRINFNFLPNLVNGILGTISSFGVGLASVLFITFFFMKDKLAFIVSIKKVLPNQHEDKILHSLSEINGLLSRYFIGLLLQLFIVFILYFIVLLIFGVENSFIIAFLCAILNIIPYIGPLIASLLALVLTLMSNLNVDFQTENLPTAIYVLIGFFVVQLIDNNICQPVIFSKSVKCHPLEIFLVILSAGFLFGIIGMIIAVPLYTIIKVILKEFLPENVVVQELTNNI